MTGKSVRDVERYQAVLGGLLSEEENKYCADCQAKGNGIDGRAAPGRAMLPGGGDRGVVRG